MHSTKILKSEDFVFMAQDQEVTFTDLIPNFSVLSRLGIVSQEPTDGIGASNLIMACVTEFYNFYRHQNDFFTYPDYFSFQASEILIDYSHFDIWPSHKNLQVEREPEKILKALNDRGIDILLVPCREPIDHVFEPATLSSAKRRIQKCFLYNPGNGLPDHDLTIKRQTAPFYDSILTVINSISDPVFRNQFLNQWREQVSPNGETIEAYCQVNMDEALRFLPF
ncbi:TPA: hypothetical protein EYN09_23545 [Candidatus Poribacteria bacterium]|nr:hypothetical protein [Candidatus Poribacteria bacterium]HIC17044.1 hypothetical protein [Candidatus Poribacteria bacterium]HIN29687.1 hypothetical protein [Candidatus Poribacteria bacterium]HIO09895.1 hypothetical protein [Candidatus Poribacteria bacterium]HIO81803.1 hypothetical protein [Candidatus Poribacteria bacterium]